jgi:diketogulonate reductase-like aldo/keto reductase
MNYDRKFILNNNSTIPTVGLGTFKGDGNNVPIKHVCILLQALRFSYRHIDTAAAYDNEKDIG